MFGRLINPLAIIYSLPAIIVAFTLHEYMHAYVADKLGDPTPRMNGRLTLNPIVHVDFVGLLMIILMGFGWAKPVMINPNNFKNRKKGKVLCAVSGPFTNLAIAFVFYGIIYFTQTQLMGKDILLSILTPFFTINIMLFAFNMLPIPPLDGFSLLEIFIPLSKYNLLAKIRRFGMMALFLLAIVGVLRYYINFVYSIVEFVFRYIFMGIEMFVGLF